MWKNQNYFWSLHIFTLILTNLLLNINFLNMDSTSSQSKILLTFAFVSDVGSRSSPRSVIVKRQALITIRTCSIMFALTNSPVGVIESCWSNALWGVSVTFASRSNSHIGDGVEIGLKHLFVTENFITEGVETIQGDLNFCSRYPFLRKNKRFKPTYPRNTCRFNALLMMIPTQMSNRYNLTGVYFHSCSC